MLFYYLQYFKYICIGMLLLSVFVTACAAQAYSVNAARSQDDPEKKEFRLGGLIFVFFTWPILLPAVVSLFLIRALLYGIFILIFSAFLILMPRVSSEPAWLERKILKIGNALLEVNTVLIKLLFRPWEGEAETI